MQSLSTNLVVASLGPFAELFGVGVLVGLFSLLRGQADRRPYFRAWERSWVTLAAALMCGVLYQRFTDLSSVLYTSSRFASWLFGFAYLALRLLALSLFVAGARLFVSGARQRWYVKAAVPVALVLPFAHDTPLGALGLAHGPFAVGAYVYGAALLAGLPPSRRSLGTRLASRALAALAALWAGLVAFHASAKFGWALAAAPWLVRFERYSFFLDLALQLALAYAMVRLLFEDGEREADDTRAQVELLHDRQRLADLHDEETGLLNRRAFAASVGLDFARASFGSLVRLRVTNFERMASTHGGSVGESMLKHFAATLDHAVRAHDRVYRWEKREFLVVLPRTVPATATARMQSLLLRAAPLQLANVRETIRPEVRFAVAPFTGGDDLAVAAREVADDASLKKAE